MSQRICQVLAVLLLVLNAPEAIAVCTPDPPMDNDAVVCDGISTGYDGSGATGLTITTTDTALLDESDPGLDSAILVGDANDVTIDADAQITVTENAGFGIRGGNDNFILNQGTITINAAAADGRGISIGENTTGVLPNGAVNTGDIIVNANSGIAIETGRNSGVATSGLLDLIGDASRGISAADHSDATIAANITNSSIINVGGNDAYGIKAGDGWVEGTLDMGTFVPSAAGIRNFSNNFFFPATINVIGDNSFGIFAGDESIPGSNNSFVSNGGIIDVTGTDSIGVSLGGNDLLDRFDIESPGNSLIVYGFTNDGSVTGDEDSGPLVVFRSFVSGKENRLWVGPAGEILADLANQGATDRAIAIRGSIGDEFIVNFGAIQGDIQLDAGDDRYVHNAGATLTGSVFGGSGNDQLLLSGGPGVDDSFDVSLLDEFESIWIGGGAGWELLNVAGFGGLTEIALDGRLRVPTPITLEGDFTVDPTGTLEVSLEGTTAPLTILGMSTFDGTLVVNVNQGPRLTPSATPYRVIDANGGYTGVFANPIQFPDAFGVQVFTPIYDAMGLSVLLEEGLVLVAQGANQRAIAQHLDDVNAAGGASADLQNLIDELWISTGTFSKVYVALSPEVYDVHTTVVVEGGRRIANLLLDRPRECQTGEFDPWRRADAQLPCHARKWSPWLAAIGGFRSREKFSNHPRYDVQMGGLVFGIDARPIGGLDLTFAISSQRGTLNAAGAGKSTVTLTDLSGQAAWTSGALRVQGVLSWGHGFHQDRRKIHANETPTPLDSRANTDHDSDRITIAAEAGFAFDLGPATLEPIAGLDWAWVYQRPIHEKDAGGFGIRIPSRDDSIGSVNAGFRLSTTYHHSRYLANYLEWMDGVWQPVLDVRWRQLVAGDDRDIDARLEGSPDTVSDFTISGKEDSGGVEIGTGISFTPRHANRLQFDLRYEAYVASHTVDHDLVARVMIGF